MSKYALIIGGSSGIGLATALKLAESGYKVTIIHRDRRSVLEAFYEKIAPFKDQMLTLNFDATTSDKILEKIPAIKDFLGGSAFHLMLHSISRGNLKPVFSDDGPMLSDQDFSMTAEAMATNLLTWTRIMVENDLVVSGSRIIALTSAGSTKVWEGYAAVGVAKAALETLSNYLAVELAPKGIRVNTIHAGITVTPSLEMIPNSEELKKKAIATNPYKRLTTPEDVANAVYLLTLPEADWINGSLIHVDGGEHLKG